jgi:2'-5' RNA ligase
LFAGTATAGEGGEVNGIFITAELEGEQAARIRAIQERHDPKLAREFPPHVSLIGSSGAGPIDPGTPLEELRASILGVTDRTAPIRVIFEPPHRFIGREIVVLPIDPHGPIRALHEAIKMSGVAFASARWPFTPHCTLNYYATLTPERLKVLLAVNETEPWEIHTVRVYHTRDGEKAKLLFDAPLRGAVAKGR